MFKLSSILCAILLLTTIAFEPNSPTTDRVNISSQGEQSNNQSYGPAISDDGRYVTFSSHATNLVQNDTNTSIDIFVHDRQTHLTERVSLNSQGEEANSSSLEPDISADGRYITFFSHATNLTPNDTNNQPDIFLHDTQTGLTELISLTPNGQPFYSYSSSPAISPDGRYVAFDSGPGVYIRDRLLGITERLDVNDAGQPGNSYSASPRLSADGRYVVFYSQSSNLVANDSNATIIDVFLRDRLLATTELISLSMLNQPTNGTSASPDITDDGRYIVFSSRANNIVVNDYNGVTDVFMRDRMTQETFLLSKNLWGQLGNDISAFCSILPDGSRIAFHSWATNLVTDDTNQAGDIFIYDLQKRFIYRASIGTNGQGNLSSLWPAMASDGFIIAFGSEATNLVIGDTNKKDDIFVHHWQLYNSYLPIIISP